MGTENSQFDLSGIQLHEARTQPRVSYSREIGEAQIVHTIFGKAKVRIIRKNDKRSRNMWMAAALVVVAVGVAGLLGWYAMQRSEAGQGTDLVGEESAQNHDVVLDSKSGSGESPAISSSEKNIAVIPPLGVTSKPVVSSESEQQQASGLNEGGQKDKEPVVVQEKPAEAKPRPVKPLTKNRSQTASANTLKNQTDESKPSVIPPAKQSAVPTRETSATSAAAQHSASSPAAAAPLASPVDTGEVVQSPVDNKQLSDPVDMQDN